MARFSRNGGIRMSNKPKVSNAIIRRLPRYRRYLGHLQTRGVRKVSSNELSEMIGYTASQIRQDLNTFGDREYKTVVVGVGNLGQAITNYTYYYKIGFNIMGLFDVNPKIIGNWINDVEVMDYNELTDYCKREHIDIGIICVNRENAQTVADDLIAGGVKGIWNFAPVDLVVPENVALESVHLSDSLHALSFMIKSMSEKENEDK